MKSKETKKYFISFEYLKNILSSFFWFVAFIFLEKLELASLISLVAISNFIHGIVGTFFGEKYYQEIFHKKDDETNYFVSNSYCLTISLPIVLVTSLILWFVGYFGIVEIFAFTISTLLAATYNLNRGYCLGHGKFKNLSLSASAECIVLLCSILICIYYPSFCFIFIFRISLANFILILTKNNKKFILLSQYFNLSDIPLCFNLMIKSALHNLDVILVQINFGPDQQITLKFFNLMSNYFQTILGIYWSSQIYKFINRAKKVVNYVEMIHSLKIYFLIVILLIGFLVILFPYWGIIHEVSVTKSFVNNWQVCGLVYVCLVIPSLLLSKWPRVILLLSNKINYSTYINMIYFVSFCSFSYLANTFFYFLLFHGLTLLSFSIFYNINVINQFNKRH